MKVLQRLMAKPWEHAGEMEGIHGGNVAGRPPGRTGLYLFLGVVTSLFFLFSISHQMRSTYPDWAAVAEPAILWINTVILLLASIALQVASMLRCGDRPVRSGMGYWLPACLACCSWSGRSMPGS